MEKEIKAVLTGFEPFGKYLINPAEKIVKELDKQKISNVVIVGKILPNVFREARGAVEEIFEKVKPDIAIHIGLAATRSSISVERVAINLIDARIPDNKGFQPRDKPINPNAPIAYFSTLPIKKIVENLNSKGIPAVVSNTAGLYMCNYIMFTSLHYSATNGYPKKTGFIHVPCLPEQAVDITARNIPSMCFELELEAIKAAIKITAR